MTTIQQIAVAAEVSPATVSRVLNGSSNVSAEKTERVRRAIADLG
jgi:LacI family transcriptional regulator